MPDRDVAHEQTEKALRALERRIAQVYAEARDGVKQTIEKYWAGLVERDRYMRALVQKGEITEDYYKQWLQNQIGRGERYEALQNQLAERVTNAAETAYAYINDTTPSVYSLNRNYGAYTIERATGSVGFTIWDESTVRRLLVQQPELMPYYPPKKALKYGIDLEWGKKQIRAAIQSGILRGESIGEIANDLRRRIPDMSRKSALRTARTAITSAQNGGRMDSYKSASDMGIKVRKRWVATKDSRTRDAHQKLDGKTIDWDEPFLSELGEIRYPGDPRAKPANLYGCRCTLRTVEKPGIEAEPRKMRVRDPKTGRNVVVEEMTYEQWAEWKNPKEAKNKYGDEIVFRLDGMSEIGKIETNKKVKILSNQYKTGLREVQFNKGLGASKGKESGRVDVSGSIMEIVSSDIVEHEFFHTLDSSKRAKYNDLETSLEFWKEAKRLFSKYKKEANKNNQNVKISDYSTTNVDEFMAECFSVANGATPVDSFGVGRRSPYVREAMEIIDRYFKR